MNSDALLIAVVCVLTMGLTPLAEAKSAPGTDVVSVDFATGGEAGIDVVAENADVMPNIPGIGDGDPLGRGLVVNGIDPQRQWMRVASLRITDEAFLTADHAVVDLEVAYHLPAWGAVEVEVRAGDGWRSVTQLWGDSKTWKTVTVRLTPEDMTGDMPIRFAAANGTLHLKYVRLTGYRASGPNVHWDRLLIVDELTPTTPDGLFAFTPGDVGTRVKVSNVAGEAAKVDWSLQLFDQSGQGVAQDSGTATVPAGSSSRFLATLDTAGLPLGPYRGELALSVDGVSAGVTPIVLGLIDDGPRTLPRAADGDAYWFGLDASHGSLNPSGTPIMYAYYDLMGVDILRGTPNTSESIAGLSDLDALAQRMYKLAEHGMRASFIMFPDDWRKDGTAYENDRLKRLERLAAVADRFGGQGVGEVPMMELGNEPDLPQFYGDPVEQYVDAYHAAYDAIKATTGGQKTDVGIGGLCFHSAVGDRNARRILELLEPDKVDAWTYHAHGPGVESERKGYERQVDAIRRHVRGNVDEQLAKPFYETESGVAAAGFDNAQEQARTTVEKQVYAMSVGMRTLMYFRLVFGGPEGSYSMTMQLDAGEDHARGEWNQPRASVLAYRQLVRQLRHHEFVTMVDAGVSGVEAYLFARDDRRVLVTFNTEPRRHTLFVRTGPTDAATITDMYGNAVDAPLLGGDTVGLDVGVDATYLTWTSTADPGVDRDGVEIAPPPVQLADGQRPELLAGREVEFELALGVTAGIDGSLTLHAEAHGVQPITVAPSTQTIGTDGGASVTVAASAGTDVLSVPTWWKVFPRVDARAVLADPRQLAEMPAKLPGSEMPAVFVSAREDGQVNLVAVNGGFAEGRPSVAVAHLDAPAEQVMRVGINADWWSAVFVNGERVFDTLDTGNGAYSPTGHVFELPLRAGRNVVAVLVRSGSQGFAFNLKGPERLRVAEQQTAAHRLDLKLVDAGGITVARQSIALTLTQPVPPLGDVSPDEPAAWMPLQPLAIMGGDDVDNPHEAQPDSSRWYKGDDDLSAIAWARLTEDGEVVLLLHVRDNEPSADPAPTVTLGDAAVEMELVERTDATRSYRLPTSVDTPQRVTITIPDHDGGFEKQTLTHDVATTLFSAN